MSPTLLAQSLAKHLETPPFNVLLRVWWEDEHAFQVDECAGEWTGMDCLVVGLVDSKLQRCKVYLVIDGGSTAVFVAHAWRTQDGNSVSQIIDGYEDRIMASLGDIAEPNRKRSVKLWPSAEAINAMMVEAIEVARNEALFND
jgi:hypothetical protein